jgi:hypothetical protein
MVEVSKGYLDKIKMAKNIFSQKLKNISNLLYSNYTLSVGWFEGDKYSNDLKVGDVAKWQEYGVIGEKGRRIPPRPFVRPAMAENSNKWRKSILKNIKNEMSKKHVEFLNNIFKELGKEVKEDIQKSIQEVYEPPLAKSTVQNRMRKRGVKDFSILENMEELTKPLIDTGRMLNSCKYNVKKG